MSFRAAEKQNKATVDGPWSNQISNVYTPGARAAWFSSTDEGEPGARRSAAAYGRLRLLRTTRRCVTRRFSSRSHTVWQTTRIAPRWFAAAHSWHQRPVVWSGRLWLSSALPQS